MSVSLGWVLVQHFREVFRLGSGNIKQACQRVGRRLRGDGFETAGYQKEVVGRPPKMARLRDLRSVYFPKLLWRWTDKTNAYTRRGDGLIGTDDARVMQWRFDCYTTTHNVRKPDSLF